MTNHIQSEQRGSGTNEQLVGLSNDQLKAKMACAYTRGYQAGMRRKKKEKNAFAKKIHEDAMWHRYMAAALSECVSAAGWKAGDKPINDIPARTSLAADFADAAISMAKQMGRM